MDSDEELKLMSEVEDLRSQLKEAGHPIDQYNLNIFNKNLETKKTPAERIPKWMIQRETLRQRLERLSGRAAVSPVVAHHDQTPNNSKRTALDSRS